MAQWEAVLGCEGCGFDFIFLVPHVHVPVGKAPNFKLPDYLSLNVRDFGESCGSVKRF